MNTDNNRIITVIDDVVWDVPSGTTIGQIQGIIKTRRDNTGSCPWVKGWKVILEENGNYWAGEEPFEKPFTRLEYEYDKHGNMRGVWAKYPNGTMALVCMCTDPVWAARIICGLELFPEDKQTLFTEGMRTKLDSDRMTDEQYKAKRTAILEHFLALSLSASS